MCGKSWSYWKYTLNGSNKKEINSNKLAKLIFFAKPISYTQQENSTNAKRRKAENCLTEQKGKMEMIITKQGNW